jgi:hypothetical protein
MLGSSDSPGVSASVISTIGCCSISTSAAASATSGPVLVSTLAASGAQLPAALSALMGTSQGRNELKILATRQRRLPGQGPGGSRQRATPVSGSVAAALAQSTRAISMLASGPRLESCSRICSLVATCVLSSRATSLLAISVAAAATFLWEAKRKGLVWSILTRAFCSRFLRPAIIAASQQEH